MSHPKPLISKMAHICLESTDLERTRHYYGEILGMETAFDFRKDETLYGFYLKVGGGSFIEVFGTGRAAPLAPEKGVKHLCLEVPSVDAVEARLLENNQPVWGKKLGCDQTWQIWSHDPDGIPIEFHQYTEESLQLRGGVCKVDW